MRTLIDTRRVLMKSETRYQQAVAILHQYAAGIRHSAGPVHGFVVKAATVGIVISIEQDGEIWMHTQLGAKMKLRTCHETHYKACIRESCRYAAIQHLCERNEQANKEVGRQDMHGIKPYIDLHATLAIVNKKPKSKSNEDEDSRLGHDEEEEGNFKEMCKPCWLEPKRHRTLNTIIAGSIRPPHRLMHAKVKVMQDDLCTQPQCKGARSDTMHIFWNCHRWKGVREPYLRALNNKTEMVKKVSLQRLKALRQVLDNNCFRQ
jgi:hypothetical protein